MSQDAITTGALACPQAQASRDRFAERAATAEDKADGNLIMII
jgi:hypothetical protein